MGKAIKEAKVKVGGQAGPMGQGQGVPLTQAVGQGGLKGAMDGKPVSANTQVPGAKGLWDRVQSTGRLPGKIGQVWDKFSGGKRVNVPGQIGGGLFTGARGVFGKLAGNKQFQQLIKKRQGLIGNIFGKSGPGMATPGQPVNNPVGHAGTPGVAKLPPPTSY